MPDIGERAVRVQGSRTWELEYQPHAVAFRGPYVQFNGGKLGTPVGDGWVRIYGEGLMYPYLENGQIIGGPRG